MKQNPRVQSSKFKVQSSPSAEGKVRHLIYKTLSFPFLILNSSFLVLSSCAPTVQLNTPEPLKVDINMQVDVYQRQATNIPALSTLTEEEAKALRRRDERSGEIWAMKNDGVATENENGYLEAHPLSGWDSAYVDGLIAEENKDRYLLYAKEAQKNTRPLAIVEKEAGKRLRQQTYAPHPKEAVSPER